MTTRSANATIKGYFYQFDHTIERLLRAASASTTVVVEGVEDIDLDDGVETKFIQCKYYEGSEYNHSLIKDAVIAMLRHFHANGCPRGGALRYKVYGHYQKGQEKLTVGFGLNVLKKNFLTYTHEKKLHEVHAELKVTEQQLAEFLAVLDIDLKAPSYEAQQQQVLDQLVLQIPGCVKEDAEAFYYPNAINVIQSLAIRKKLSEREITKGAFMSAVNRKDAIFGIWLRKKFGDDHYARSIKRRHFKFGSTKVPKSARIFAIDLTNGFELTKAVELLARIGNGYSHVEHTRTPAVDRFCPYVLLRGIAEGDMVLLKGALLKQGIRFDDGYAFKGADFSPSLLAAPPSKENLFKLKFIADEAQVRSVASAISGTAVELFDFYYASPLGGQHVPTGVPHHKYQIDAPYFINQIL